MFFYEIRLTISLVCLYTIFKYCGIFYYYIRIFLEKCLSEGCYLPVTIQDCSLSLYNGYFIINKMRIHSPPKQIDPRWLSDKVMDIEKIVINFNFITLLKWLYHSNAQVIKLKNVEINNITFYIEGWENPVTGEMFTNVSLIAVPPEGLPPPSSNTSAKTNDDDINNSNSILSINYWNGIYNNVSHFSTQVLQHGFLYEVYSTAKRSIHYSLKQKIAQIHESMSGPEPLPESSDIRLYGYKIEIRNTYLYLRNAMPVPLRHLEKKPPLFVPYFEILLHNVADRIIPTSLQTPHMNSVGVGRSSTTKSTSTTNSLNSPSKTKTSSSNIFTRRIPSFRLFRQSSYSADNIWRSVEREYYDPLLATASSLSASLSPQPQPSKQSQTSATNNNNINKLTTTNDNLQSMQFTKSTSQPPPPPQCHERIRRRSISDCDSDVNHPSISQFNSQNNLDTINNTWHDTDVNTDMNDDNNSVWRDVVLKTTSIDQSINNNNNNNNKLPSSYSYSSPMNLEESCQSQPPHCTSASSVLISSTTTTSSPLPPLLLPLAPTITQSSEDPTWAGLYPRYCTYELNDNLQNGIHSKIVSYRFERALIGAVLEDNAGNSNYL